VLRAVALAGGLTPMALAKRAKILHQDASSSTHTEMASNVRNSLLGKLPMLHCTPMTFIRAEQQHEISWSHGCVNCTQDGRHSHVEVLSERLTSWN
jgi:hypothetical protein